jgi:hypothetical protein
MLSEYRANIAAKQWTAPAAGFDPTVVPSQLFDWQRAVLRWACKKGRAALFEDCGLGKTIQQIAWAENVRVHTGGSVLILAPLAVADQTVREGGKIGIEVRHIREVSEIDGEPRIYVTNYDRLHRFTERMWGGVVLDESSIIKSYNGSTRNLIIETFSRTDYRLACTATPSPNDHTELGNHAEFLGVMTRTEMLASFFVHDGAETSVWRLKGHAQRDFWQWVAGWAIMMRTPADIGFRSDGYVLPELKIIRHVIASGIETPDTIFAMPAQTLSEQRAARRMTMQKRVDMAAALASVDGPCLVWCEMNDEGDMLEESIEGSVQVAGANDEDEKSSRMMGFADGIHRCLVTKPKLAGFGMNWQHCNRMVFVGLSHSYEQFYQAVRRCWRFGQSRPVEAHIITTDIESEIMDNIDRKQAEADAMTSGMVEHMAEITKAEIVGTDRQEDEYRTATVGESQWTANLGDCVEGISKLPNESVHYSVFSPPFASLYTYSNSPFDMGNCKDHGEFFRQFVYLTRELFRVIKTGRLVSFHCMNLPTSKERDGFIGIVDFRGILIRAFQDAGFIFHSEVCIWKDPVTAMQRTKALGLLHKTIRKDSAMSRQGIADYLVTMRKPGLNPEPIPHSDDLPVSLWQRYASPVWMDIRPSDTLQKESAREENDERHICPLQLGVIERCIHLWSNPGDLVLSPFMGIGSEGYMALKMGRRFVGFELKSSYYQQAVANLKAVSGNDCNQQTIFDAIQTSATDYRNQDPNAQVMV